MYRVVSWCVLAVAALAFLSGKAHATNFAILLQGGNVEEAVEIANVESITMEDLVIDEREMTTGADWDYRVYGPGDAHFGSITIRVWRTPGQQNLLQWWSQTSKGKDIRKNISVDCLKRDGSPARKYNFHECYPTQWKAGERIPGSRLPVLDTLVVQPQGFDMEAAESDERTEPTGLEVGIAGDDGSLDIDSDFASWGGGEPVTVDDSAFKETQFHTTTPGHKYIDTLTLRGPLTSGRKALCQWITETVAGKDSRRTITVKEILKDGGAGKTFVYFDGFPTRYVFPKLKADSTAEATEFIECKMGRVELR